MHGAPERMHIFFRQVSCDLGESCHVRPPVVRMNISFSKRIALSVAGLALVVVVAAGVLFQGVIVEWFYLVRLGAEHETSRRVAASSLARMKSERAVPLLAEIFEREPGTPGELHYSVLALVEIGEPAVPALANALEHEEEDVRIAAAVALARMGRVAERAAPALLRVCLARSGASRVHARSALVALGAAAVPSLTDALESANGELRVAALNVLSELGPEARAAVPALMQFLDVREVQERNLAARALKTIGAPSVRPLVAALAGGSEIFRRHAVTVLASLGRLAFPRVIDVLEEGRTAVRPHAMRVLQHMAADPPPDLDLRSALPALNRRLRDASPTGMLEAATTMLAIDPGSTAAIDATVDYLQNERTPASPVWARERSFLPLIRAGAPAVSHLVRIYCATRSAARRETVGAVLERLGEAGVAGLAELLECPDRSVRLLAIRMLARKRSLAKGAVPALRSLLGSQDEELSLAAADALASITPGTVEAVPGTIRALFDASARAPVRLSAAGRLVRFAREHKGAMDALKRALEDRNEDLHVRLGVAERVVGDEAVAAQCSGTLLRLVRDPDEVPEFRGRLAELLAAWQPGDEDVLHALKSMARDEDPEIRLSAASTLVALDPEIAIAALVDLLAVRGIWGLAEEQLVAMGDAVSWSLAGALEHDQPTVRVRAAGLIERHRRELPSLPVYLREIARKETSPGQGYAALCLLELHGADASSLAALVVRLLDDRFRPIRSRAQNALARAGDPAIPSLRTALGERNANIRESAALILARSHATREEALPVLIDMLTVPSARRVQARDALKRIGEAAVLPLAEIVKDVNRSTSFRTAAIDALGAMGAVAHAAVPALTGALETPGLENAARSALAAVRRDG